MQRDSGFTLLEVMIALTILAGMSLTIFISSSQILNSKSNTEERDETYHSVTLALNRMSEDLNMAYLLRSKDLLGANFDGEIAFEGSEERVDFVSFSHLRYVQGAPESESAEISYFLAPMPDEPSKKMLMRRESTLIDKNLQEGGRAFPLLENIESFKLEYLDEKSGEFKKVWDTKSIDFANKMPQAVRIQIELLLPEEEQKTTFTTLAPIKLQGPIAF